ncbi:class I SAM-dependent methyltransferase [Xanthocytophaga flava]|uniref:class I SAM-dependent methyltransferase n=1 Tax=Xanthocytophaga flava TaxID=3048013 RepID=UPI0028D474FE|nr:class I SAM-dependent methyltransferase [Xanthocytophaga flavus]MDJ1467986.1 class I SAM-dependent methyltransferase [Xanthocytophaga flavus]
MKDIYHADFVRQLFNSMSASYERMNFITSFGFSLLWRKQFIDKVGYDNSQVEVLDLLSGLGENWTTLIKRFPNGNFQAVDFSEIMYNKSQVKNFKKFGNRFTVHKQDILENKLPSAKFDIVTCAFGLKTFNDKQIEIFAFTLKRILKDNGRFSFIEVSTPTNKVLLTFYRFYLKHCIPFLGKIFLGNPSDYKMLWLYTEKFENSRKVKEAFEKQGLIVDFNEYFFGCATGISGKKNSCAV